MRFMIPLLLGVFLFMGCLATTPYSPKPAEPQQPAPQPEQPPANITENKTCGEYCLARPHVECVGEWNISGAYPDCNCGFVCNAEPEPGKANETVPPKPPEPQNKTVYAETNKTANQLMADGMAKLKSAYYANASGVINEKSYTWSRLPANSTSDEIPVGVSAPATDLEFDGDTIETVLASGFIVFTREDETQDIYGLAIAKARSTILDDYTSEDSFYVSYIPQPINKEIWGCYIRSKERYVNAQGEPLAEYFFQCDDVDDLE